MRVHLLGSLVVTGLASLSWAQSTAFTYQGRLSIDGAAASGVYDLRFTLFNAAVDGVAIAPAACLDNVQVTNGVFTAIIDFGKVFATNEARAIQIEVRADTGQGCADVTGFTTMDERHVITPTPTATWAPQASGLTPMGGTGVNAVSVDSAGKVGIGTPAPTHTLHIASTAPTLSLQDTDSVSQQVGYISYRDSGNVERAWIGYGSAGDPDFTIFNTRTSGDIVLLTAATGNVGIGTAVPAAKLEVRGDIRLGPVGQYFATSASENLRTIRGTVQAAGSVFAGEGWTVSRPSTGRYDVTFSTAFSDLPSCVGTAGSSGRTCVVGNVSTTGCTFFTYDSSGTLFNTSVNFIAIGPR